MRRRKTDDYPFSGLVEWLKRYAIFWIPLLWLGSNLGFGLITPKLTANQVMDRGEVADRKLQSQLDILSEREHALETVHSEIREDISAMIKFDCTDKRTTDRDRAYLRCDKR